ncbi:MAG: hypothetical protein N2489_06795 [Clostridia bacterium]|nr:hypothetical protein [Clostridia bacterium]
MVIKAVIHRIEGENAILLADEVGVEISIPANIIKGSCIEGETIALTLDCCTE